jgi:hypothetical protein
MNTGGNLVESTVATAPEAQFRVVKLLDPHQLLPNVVAQANHELRRPCPPRRQHRDGYRVLTDCRHIMASGGFCLVTAPP